MSGLALLFLTAAALGYGALLLRACGVLADLAPRERAPWSFALGFGALGWLLFWPAAAHGLSPWVMPGVLAPGLVGLSLLRGGWSRPTKPSNITAALLCLLAAVAVLDLLQALAPPADADSGAYHFALPKLFLAQGGLIFQPLAVEGAVPLLPQMTSMAALGLGGEQGMTLWAMVSGWGSAWLVWAISRRWLSSEWALALALAWKTIPAVIYAAGTGQVEVRTAMFVTIGTLAVAEATVTGRIRWLAVAGLACGFFMAAKFPGLVFAGAVGLTILTLGPQRLRGAVLFSAAAVVAGCQWYGWNWWHSGDPVFPMLWAWLPHRAEGLWSPEAAALFAHAFIGIELAVPRDPLWLVLYPFKATLAPLDAFEGGRSGLGVLPLLLLPFAVWGGWRAWRQPGRLGVALLVLGIAYAVWFLFGPSQRMRHFLPLLPVLLIALTVAAIRVRNMRAPLVAAFAATLAIQIGAQGVFSLKFMRTIGQDRDTFLSEGLPGYEGARWINGNLPADVKVFNSLRWLNYVLERPYFYAHPLYQNLVITADGNNDVARFWRQLRQQEITHLFFLDRSLSGFPLGIDATAVFSAQLTALGCAKELYRGQAVRQLSRTLPDLGGSTFPISVMELLPENCPLELKTP